MTIAAIASGPAALRKDFFISYTMADRGLGRVDRSAARGGWLHHRARCVGLSTRRDLRTRRRLGSHGPSEVSPWSVTCSPENVTRNLGFPLNTPKISSDGIDGHAMNALCSELITSDIEMKDQRPSLSPSHAVSGQKSGGTAGWSRPYCA